MGQGIRAAVSRERAQNPFWQQQLVFAERCLGEDRFIQHRLPLHDSTLAYAAAKGALSPDNKGLANEVGPKGVRVNMISPGFIETSGAHGMIVGLAKSKGIGENEARQAIMNMIGGIPIGRPAQDLGFRLLFTVSNQRLPAVTGCIRLWGL